MRFLFLLILLFGFCLPLPAEDKTVLLAILARNKGHVLPYYLNCIENLDYNKRAIIVYINTNNNEDDTRQILGNWRLKHARHYRRIIMEGQDLPELPPANPHEWNPQRFKVLGKIRDRSLDVAKHLNCRLLFCG
jgi:hypothetical protein